MPCRVDTWPVQGGVRDEICQVHAMTFIPEGVTNLALAHRNLSFNTLLET